MTMASFRRKGREAEQPRRNDRLQRLSVDRAIHDLTALSEDLTELMQRLERDLNQEASDEPG